MKTSLGSLVESGDVCRKGNTGRETKMYLLAMLSRHVRDAPETLLEFSDISSRPRPKRACILIVLRHGKRNTRGFQWQ